MSRLAPPNENIGTFISPALTGVFVSATILKPHVSPYHKPFICLLRHMVTSIPLVNAHSPLQESLTQRGTLNYDFSHNLIGEATRLHTQNYRWKIKFPHVAKQRKEQTIKVNLKKSLLYQLIITGPNVTNDFELCSSEICLLPVERRE